MDTSLVLGVRVHEDQRAADERGGRRVQRADETVAVLRAAGLLRIQGQLREDELVGGDVLGGGESAGALRGAAHTDVGLEEGAEVCNHET